MAAFPIPASYIVIDFETTDRNPAIAGIVELAVARVEAGVVAESWATLCNPGLPCSDGARAVHGISDAEIESAPPVADLLAALAGVWLDPSLPVVAYNGPVFDRVVLECSAKRAGMAGAFDGLQWLDPLPLARAMLPGLPGYTLAKVGSRLGVLYRAGDLHRAAADVEVTVGVVEGLRERDLAPPPGAPRASIVPTPPRQIEPPPADELEAAPPFLAVAGAALAATPAGGELELAPLVAEALSALAPLAKRVASWIASADSLPCTDDDEERRIVDALATFKKLAGEAVKARAKFTEEIGRQKRDIEAAWRAQVLEPLDGVVGRLEAVRKPLALARAQAAAAERRRAEAEAAEIAEAERQRLLAEQVAPLEAVALEAAIAGDANAEAAALSAADAGLDNANDTAQAVYEQGIAQAAAIAPAPTRGQLATARDRITWAVRILSPRMVPAAYCSPDLAKILAAIEAADGDISIPGVAFEADLSTSTRSNSRR